MLLWCILLLIQLLFGCSVEVYKLGQSKSSFSLNELFVGNVPVTVQYLPRKQTLRTEVARETSLSLAPLRMRKALKNLINFLKV